jgi:hypothetical protein
MATRGDMKSVRIKIKNLHMPRWQWLLLIALLGGLNSAQQEIGCNSFSFSPSYKQIDPRDPKEYRFVATDNPPCDRVELSHNCDAYAKVTKGTWAFGVTANGSLKEGSCTLTAKAIFSEKDTPPQYATATVEFVKIPLKVMLVLDDGSWVDAGALSYIPLKMKYNFAVTGGVPPYSWKAAILSKGGATFIGLHFLGANNTIYIPPLTEECVYFNIIVDSGQPEEKIPFTIVAK